MVHPQKDNNDLSAYDAYDPSRKKQIDKTS